MNEPARAVEQLTEAFPLSFAHLLSRLVEIRRPVLLHAHRSGRNDVERLGRIYAHGAQRGVVSMEGHAVRRGFWTFLLVLGLSQGCNSSRETDASARAPASCTVDGLTFPDGAQEIPDGDGCNTCQCRDGRLFCTALACPVESGCRIGGKVYADGSNDVPDSKSCNCCACEGGKVTRCSQSACGLPASCRFQGFDYPHGGGFGMEPYRCRCDAGSWSCGADRNPVPRPELALWTCPTAPGVSGPDGAALATSTESLRPSMFHLPADIDQQALFDDLFMIWNMKKSLPPQANARRWFEGLRQVSKKPPRAQGNRLELLEATAQAKYASCRWSLVLSERRLRSLIVECSFQRWSALGAAFLQALGPAFAIRENGDRAVARVEYRG